MTAPTIAETLGTLHELAAAARADNRARYLDALAIAHTQGITDEQIADAYRYGRRGQGAADFDVDGHPQTSLAYDAHDECAQCSAHIAEPHAPACPFAI